MLALNVPSIGGSGIIYFCQRQRVCYGPGSPDIFYESAASYGGGWWTQPQANLGSLQPYRFRSSAEGNRGGGAIDLLWIIYKTMELFRKLS